jgi:hypothetical protein
LPTAPSRESEALRNFFLRMTDRIATDPNMDLETMRDMLEREIASLHKSPIRMGQRPNRPSIEGVRMATVLATV